MNLGVQKMRFSTAASLIAGGFAALFSTASGAQESIGKRVGIDRSSVANHLRLLELPAELQADVEAGRLSLGHAKALLQAANPERRRHLRDRIVNDGLSVRAAEELARPAGKAARPAAKARRDGVGDNAGTAVPN